LFDNPSLTNVAPRVGMALDLFGTGKTVVRGGYGVYHDLILVHNLIVAAVRNPPFYQLATIRNPQSGARLTAFRRVRADCGGRQSASLHLGYEGVVEMLSGKV
jgi:hypothetical protein